MPYIYISHHIHSFLLYIYIHYKVAYDGIEAIDICAQMIENDTYGELAGIFMDYHVRYQCNITSVGCMYLLISCILRVYACIISYPKSMMLVLFYV